MTPAAKPLTEQQEYELRAMLVGPQHTYGSGRARVQNTLVRLGLARMVEIPDAGGDYCTITDAGREAISDAPSGHRWQKDGERYVLRDGTGGETGWVVALDAGWWHATRDGHRLATSHRGKRRRALRFSSAEKAMRAVRSRFETSEPGGTE